MLQCPDEAAPSDEADDMALTYRQYIASALWREKREAALARDGHRCRLCNASKEEARIEVHHRCYPEELGTEPLEDLLTVCVECHDFATDKIRRKRYGERSIVIERRQPAPDTPRMMPFEPATPLASLAPLSTTRLRRE